jgi:hypothetical protein
MFCTFWGQHEIDVAIQVAASTWLWNSETDLHPSSIFEVSVGRNAWIVMEILRMSDRTPPVTDNICIRIRKFYHNINMKDIDTILTFG